MNGPSPARLTDQLWRAVLTLLAAAVVASIAARLFENTWRFLLVALALLLVLRIVAGSVRARSDW